MSEYDFFGDDGGDFYGDVGGGNLEEDAASDEPYCEDFGLEEDPPRSCAELGPKDDQSQLRLRLRGFAQYLEEPLGEGTWRDEPEDHLLDLVLAGLPDRRLGEVAASCAEGAPGVFSEADRLRKVPVLRRLGSPRLKRAPQCDLDSRF